MHGAGFGQSLHIGVVWGEPILVQRFGDAGGGLARFDSRRIRQIIKRAPRMRFAIAEGLILACQILQHPRQCAVFMHICQIAGVIDMLIRQHVRDRAAQTRRDSSFAARTKSLNRGCGSKGFDFSSGWN